MITKERAMLLSSFRTLTLLSKAIHFIQMEMQKTKHRERERERDLITDYRKKCGLLN